MLNIYPYTDAHELNLDWFLDEFKKVIAEVNTLEETVTQFTDFVTNYFDNLDVQTEINNKLNEMAADGTLAALIQPLFDEYKVEINADIDSQNSKISVLEARMDGFSNLPDASTAGDAELQDIRIGANGITYANAGDAVRAQVTALNDDTEILKGATFFDYVQNINVTLVGNYKFKDDGTTEADPAYNLVRFATFSDVTLITLKSTGRARFSTNTSTSGLFGELYESGHDYITVKPAGANTLFMSYRSDESDNDVYKGTLRVNPDRTVQTRTLLTSADDIDTIRQNGVYTWNTGDYPANLPSNRYGTMVVFSERANNDAVQLIFMYGGLYYIRFSHTIAGGWTDFNSIISEADKNYILTRRTKLTFADDIDTIRSNGIYTWDAGDYPANLPVNLFGTLLVYSYDNTKEVTQIVTTYYGRFYVRYSHTSSDGWTDFIDIMEEGHSPCPYSSKVFKRVGCIGDSYMAGYIAAGSDVPADYPEYSWPHFMEVLTGNTWTNFGYSGSSTKSWMNGQANLANVQAPGNKCQAYVIGLGINDSSGSHPNHVDLGTAADIGTNADSYYAYYYKLVEAVRTVNADAPIFCTTLPKGGSTIAGYNTAVRDIVTYCQTASEPVYLLDLAGDYNNVQYFKNPILSTDAENGHYTGIGYEYMAECLLKVISDVVNANNADFKNIHKIAYDA